MHDNTVRRLIPVDYWMTDLSRTVCTSILGARKHLLYLHRSSALPALDLSHRGQPTDGHGRNRLKDSPPTAMGTLKRSEQPARNQRGPATRDRPTSGENHHLVETRSIYSAISISQVATSCRVRTLVVSLQDALEDVALPPTVARSNARAQRARITDAHNRAAICRQWTSN